MSQIFKSRDHFAFIGRHEYFGSADCVFMAAIANPMGWDGQRLGTAYVCPVDQWESLAPRFSITRGQELTCRTYVVRDAAAKQRKADSVAEVAGFRKAGYSILEISAILEVSQKTVRRRIVASGESPIESKRELATRAKAEVLRLWASGLNKTAIASKVGLYRSTVSKLLAQEVQPCAA